MRSWLLLVFVLVSDLCPLGDGDWVMDYFSWSLCRKLLLSGRQRTTPRGLGTLETRTEHPCMCIHRGDCVFVAVQHKQRTSPFCWAYTVLEGHGHMNHTPLLVVSPFHRDGKSVAAFLVKSAVTTAAMHVINGAALTKAGAEASHITVEIIKDPPDSRPSRLVHHHTTASGHKFHGFLLEKSQSWAPATIVQLLKMLTKSCRVVTTVIIPRCLKEGQTKAAMTIKKISKEQSAAPRLEESKQRAMDIKVHMDNGGQQPGTALVKQHDIFPAAALHSGSSSVKSLDISPSEIHRNRASIKKKNEHSSSDEEPLLQKSVQKQLSLKAASTSVNDDGFYLTRQFLLVPRDGKESINGLRHKIRAAQDHNKERFNEKIISKQAELQRPEGQSETGPSHTNTIGYILPADSTHKTQNNDAGHKQMFTEVGEEVLIMSFLPDTETQTKQSCEIKLILNADTGWKIINTPVNELYTIKVIKEGFMIQPGNSKHPLPLEIFTTHPKEINTSPTSEITTTTTATTTSAYTKENIKETTRTMEHPQTDSVTHKNMGINYTEQEENMPSEDPVVPSPPAHKMIETEDTKAATTAVNTEIKQTTPIMEVFKINGTQKADSLLPKTEEAQTTTMNPEPETVYELRFIKNKPGNTQATTAKSFSGLRMREDILEDLAKLHEGIKDEERTYVSPATTNRPETDNGREKIPNQVIDDLQKTTDDTLPLCGGLIHRTEDGLKHCKERYARKTITTKEPTDAFQSTRAQEKGRQDNDDDGYDHFYYFDGVLKRVQQNFYPYYKGQRRQKRSHENTETGVPIVRNKRDAHENLLNYIQHLTLRNKVKREKLTNA